MKIIGGLHKLKWLSLRSTIFCGEKTEKATPKKREDAKKKDKQLKSQDVNTAIILLAVFSIFLSVLLFTDIVFDLFHQTFSRIYAHGT